MIISIFRHSGEYPLGHKRRNAVASSSLMHINKFVDYNTAASSVSAGPRVFLPNASFTSLIPFKLYVIQPVCLLSHA